MQAISRVPAFFIVSIFLILAGRLIYDAGFDPDSSFLPPSCRARWILAPHRMDHLAPLHVPTALFKKDIDLSGMSDHVVSATAEIAAARGFELYVNGQRVTGDFERSMLRNWRFSSSFQIERLLAPGKNEIVARIHNSKRTPCLLATITLRFAHRSPILYTSDSSWQTSVDGGIEWTSPEEVSKYREFWQGQLEYFGSHPLLFRTLRALSASLTLLLIGLVVMLCFPREPSLFSRFAGTPAARLLPRISGYLESHALFSSRLPFILCALLYIPLALTRDPYTGWDAHGHIEYISYVTNHWAIPYREEIWQMYQPPAYYFLAAAIYKATYLILHLLRLLTNETIGPWLCLKSVQLLTPIFAWLQVVVLRRTLGLFYAEGSKPYLVAGVFAALLPMQVYMSQFVSNEMMSSLTITLALYLFVRMLARNEICSYRQAALLGGVVGVSCLTKYTGLIVLATISLVYLVRFCSRRKDRIGMALSYFLFLAVVALVAGHFYFRNYLLRGTAVYFPQYGKEVTMEYRGLSFYVSPLNAGLGAIDKYLSRVISFPDGNYSSMWLDISQRPTPSTRIFDCAIYFLAIVPSVLIACGLGRFVLASATERDGKRQCLVMVVFFMFSLAGYIHFLLRLYTWEVVKAFYLLSSISPLALFLSAGLGPLLEDKRRCELVLRILVSLFGTIALYYFWVLAGRIWDFSTVGNP